KWLRQNSAVWLLETQALPYTKKSYPGTSNGRASFIVGNVTLVIAISGCLISAWRFLRFTRPLGAPENRLIPTAL
ncbi:MAG: hypothetical protein DMG81_09055, partial [Acidobacteria bacterium]